MARIHIYKGAVNVEAFKGLRAEISYMSDGGVTGALNTKIFSAEEARKGLEQLKRWVSTGSFSVIAINGLSSALERGSKNHLLEWIQDHSTEPDFPDLILLGEKEDKIEGLLTDVIDENGIGRLLNT